MEWAIGIPIVALLLLCPLMMVGMIIGGWLLGRKAMGGHGGHGMMCMGHGSHAGHDWLGTQRRRALVNAAQPCPHAGGKPEAGKLI